jgi:hypothetical protein
MKPMRLVPLTKPTRRQAAACAVALGLALLPVRLLAFQFEFGEIEGSLDTTLSIGASSRLSDPSRTYYATTAGGLQNSVNADDGNLNYKSGIFSLAGKATSDLEFKYKNWRAFARATYLYDHENQRGTRARTPLSKAAKDKVGNDFRMLDSFLVGQFDLGGAPLDIRIGSQVLSWGESTFIQNGINVINPIDAARIRTPGAELKEALMPVPMFSFSLGISENITVEGFYQLQWQETEIDPTGTYFSTNDFAGVGGSRVYLGFGAVADTTAYGFVPRGPDGWADDGGQWGIAARILAPNLNSTEFGLYAINYHSRLPLISARTPTSAISAAYVQATASSLAQANLAPAMINAGYPAAGVPAALTTLLGAALTGVPVSALPSTLQPFYPAAQTIASSARTLGFFQSAATGAYLIEYPEDIQLFGASFNTDVGTTGISLQGEVSYKVGQPLQIDDVELLFAALSSINPAFGPNNQMGNYLGQLNTRVQGWKRKDVWQAQFTATKVLSGILGASQWVVLGEMGATLVPHLPEKDSLRFDGSGTFTGGSQAYMTGSGNGQFPATPLDAFADDFSWGYQLATRLDYNNAFFGMNMSPSLAFSHDVSGNTPLPLGNFLSGRKSATVAVEFTYLNAWACELRYVNYFGAGRYNLLGDRDFVSATIKYSF